MDRMEEAHGGSRRRYFTVQYRAGGNSGTVKRIHGIVIPVDNLAVQSETGEDSLARE